MTTKSFITSLLSDADESIDEIARRAAKRARKQKVQWSAFVRMIARNSQIKVELTGGTPRTDGKTVWLRIPLELGLDVPHLKGECGKRDGVRLTCPACDLAEDITITILHEVSHILFDSMAEVDEAEKIKLLKKAIEAEAGGSATSSRPAKIWAKLQKRNYTTFFDASHTVSPWLGLLLNAVEDVRVNAKMMEARPGTQVMFKAQSQRVFQDGILRNDGHHSSWGEAPPNAQAIISAYCEASGIDNFTDHLDAELLAELLADPDFKELCLRSRTARSVRSEFEISVDLLECLRKHGFCLAPEDEEDEPEPEPEPEQEPGDPSDEEGEDEGDGGKGEQDDVPDTGDEPKPQPGNSPGEGEGEGDGSGGDSDTSEDTDETDDSEGESAGGDDPSDEDYEPDSDGKDSDSEGSDGDEPDEAEEGGDTGEGDGEGESGDEGDDEGDLDNPDFTGNTYTEEDLKRDGTPDEVEELFKKFGRHDDEAGGESTGLADAYADHGETNGEKVERALAQVDFFDSVSHNIYGVEVHTDVTDPKANAWRNGYEDERDLHVEERIMSPALMHLRRVFADNRSAKHLRNLKSGKIDARVLGTRALAGDPRLFKHKDLPGKKDYFVLIGLDVSGSTNRPGVIELIKLSAYAQAELCKRLGVKFAVYAHTGNYNENGMVLDMYEIKAPNGLWDGAAKHRLAKLRPASANLDGHTLEYYRKVAEGVNASNRLVMYYTDGAMPLENYAEELEILQREIEVCRRQGIGLVGVGIRNDDPTQHGLDTIRLDRIEDVPLIIKGLEERLK